MSTPDPFADIWNSGAAYQQYVGRWSLLVGREFLDWLDLPEGLRWLDVGCGTGALSGLILDTSSPDSVTGIDPSTGFIAYARENVRSDRVRFETGDARSLPLESDSVDAVVSGLVLNFVPNDEQSVAAAEQVRVCTPGGTIAAYVWDYAEGMQMMRHFWNVAIMLDPQAISNDESSRFTLCHPDRLEALFTSAGIHEVEVRAIDVPTRFSSFDDYWTPFLSGQAPAPKYAMSLAADHRDELRETLRNRLPTNPDGSIDLTARAWAIRGRVPQPV